jgi:hypothetical protein
VISALILLTQVTLTDASLGSAAATLFKQAMERGLRTVSRWLYGLSPCSGQNVIYSFVHSFVRFSLPNQGMYVTWLFNYHPQSKGARTKYNKTEETDILVIHGFDIIESA